MFDDGNATGRLTSVHNRPLWPFAKLLPDQERELGRDHPTTLSTLPSIAKFAIENDNQPEVCRWLRARGESAHYRGF